MAGIPEDTVHFRVDGPPPHSVHFGHLKHIVF